MSRVMHLCLDIRGAIQGTGWKALSFKGMRRRPTKVEAINWLMDRLAEGKKVLPMAEDCEGFSYETGCPGHEEPGPVSDAGGGSST